MTALTALPPTAFAELVDKLPMPVAVCSADGQILHVSPALNETFGSPPSAKGWQGRAFGDLPLKAGLSVSEPDAKVYLLDDGSETSQRFRKSSATIGGDGHGAIAVHFLMPVSSPAADVLHPLAALAGRSSNIDPESGLQDRAAISQVLHSEVARCRRYNNPLSVIMIVLRQASGAGLDDPQSLCAPAVLGQMLAEQTRWADATGRWSDAQFLLVLPETNLMAAEYLCDKIRASTAKLEQRGIEIELRLSAGQWQQGDDARALIARAEAGLQVAVEPA